MRGKTHVAGELWGRVEHAEEKTDQRILAVERKRYERIVNPLQNAGAFRRGYEMGRAATTDTIDSLPAPKVPAS